MLTAERSKNQHLTEKATKTKLILETLAARGDKEGSGMGPLLKLLNGGKKTQGENSKTDSEISKSSVNSSNSSSTISFTTNSNSTSTGSTENTISIRNTNGNTENTSSIWNNKGNTNIFGNSTSTIITNRGTNSNITGNTTTNSTLVGSKFKENITKTPQTTLKEASLMVRKKPPLKNKKVENLNESMSIPMRNPEAVEDQKLDLKKNPSELKTPVNSDLQKFPGLEMTPFNKITTQGLTKDMKLDLDRKKEDSTVVRKEGGNTTNADLEKYTDLMKKINQQLSNTRKTML